MCFSKWSIKYSNVLKIQKIFKSDYIFLKFCTKFNSKYYLLDKTFQLSRKVFKILYNTWKIIWNNVSENVNRHLIQRTLRITTSKYFTNLKSWNPNLIENFKEHLFTGGKVIIWLEDFSFKKMANSIKKYF